MASPLDSIDIASKVFPFLGAHELLNFVSCRKDYSKREYLTYHRVIRSALLSKGFQSIHFLQLCVLNHKEGKKDLPNPLGILKFACGKDARGDLSQDDNDQNAIAIQMAIDKNEPDYYKRAIWKQNHVDRILQQIADLLGDHPCRDHVLEIKGRRPGTFWNPNPFLHYDNNFVYGTLDCVLDLNDPHAITKQQLVQASCELKEYYDESERQLRILECLYAMKNSDAICAWLLPRWSYPEKRYTLEDKGMDSILQLEKVLMNRDKDRPPAVVAKEISYIIRSYYRRQRWLRSIRGIRNFWRHKKETAN